MASNLSFRIGDILPMEDLEAMGRRRYQSPSVFRTKGKRPMWYFRARIDVLETVGDDRKESVHKEGPRQYLGYCDEMTKQEAKKRRDEVLAEAINKPQVLIPSQVRFMDVLKVYRRDHLPNLRDTTRRTQENVLEKHFEGGLLGKLRMCDLDAQSIQQWLSGLSLAYQTKKAYLALLRVIWRKAEDWGYTKERFPRAKFALGPERGVKGRELPLMDQVRRLLAKLEDPHRAMAEIALYTGLRISEIRGLQWGDFQGGALVIRRRVSDVGGIDVPKSKKGYRVLDSRPLEGVLSRLDRSGVWLFDPLEISYQSCLRAMQEAREAAGITVARFSWHHLRAICNTLLRGNGADAVDRQALLGHSSERMNAVYIMQDAEDVRRRGDLMLSVQAAIMGYAVGGKAN